MDGWLLFFIIAVIGGGIMSALLPFIMVLAALGQVRKFHAALARQAQIMQSAAQAQAMQPAAQEAFAQAARDAGAAANTLRGQRAIEAQQQLLAMLTAAAQHLPPGQGGHHAYRQGGDIVIPNGPAIINGQLYIPR